MPNDQSVARPKIIAVVNQKGGVGKTTTTINLAAALGGLGLKTLIVDLDPQGNASTGLGIDADQRATTIYDVLLEEADVIDAIVKTDFENLDIIPTTTDLSSADIELVSNEKRSFLLHDSLRSLDVDALGYDVILIDCPPSLSLLTVNALIACHSLLIPLQSEFFALEGLSQLMLTVRDIRETANPKLRIEGVLLTMYDKRNNLSLQVEQDARETLKEIVFKTMIPRNVRLSEAPSYAMPIREYDPVSLGGKAYDALAQELLGNWASNGKG